jgi:hypothetical protein
MPSLGQLVEPTRPLVVTFGAADLTLAYRPSAVTPRFQKAVAAAQRDGDLDALILEPLCRLIANWDLTDEDGTPVALTPDALADLPVPVLVGLMTAIGEDMAPDPLKGAVSSSTSPRTAASAASRNGT